MFLKRKKVRLKGEALAQLNSDIHERDDHTCIIKGCGRFVLEGVKFHHQPFGINKQDRIECGCSLCPACHHELHFCKNGSALEEQCENYLASLYPDYWDSMRWS